MAFKTLPTKTFSDDQIAGFWTRKQGESITGLLSKRVPNDKGKEARPFYLVKLTVDGGTVASEEKETPGVKGDLIGVAESYALRELANHIGALIRLTAIEPVKNPHGGNPMHQFVIEIDDEPAPF